MSSVCARTDRVSGADRERFQPFPTKPPLRNQVDLSLIEIATRVDGRGPDRRVFPYVVDSVRRGEDDGFRQTGCSPNMQGGFMTLCNCKRHMRSSEYMRHPGGVWIAGVTSSGLYATHRRYLFYLMFARPVRSQAEMWARLPIEAREAKSASRHQLGELYEPKRNDLHGFGAFSPESYKRPIDGHTHLPNGEWRQDIDTTYGIRRPTLLLGDEELSFVWARTRLWLVENSKPLPRNPSGSENIASFLSRIRDEASRG